jgi:hypothetical protein
MKFIITLLLWSILLVLCWPLALVLLIFYPIIWLVALPFRLLGIAVSGIFSLIESIIMLPFHVLNPSRR